MHPPVYAQEDDYAQDAIITYKWDMDAGEIQPLHEVRDYEKLEQLVQSMETDGWSGRPLLVLTYGDNQYYAMTGSHRLAAAQEVGVEVPCYIIEDTENTDLLVDMFDASRDEERLDALEALAEVADIPDEYVQLMREELNRT